VIVLDTTVLVHAVGDSHSLREPCRRLVSRIGAGEIAATTTVEAIQEFAHVRARRRDRQDAAHLAAGYAALLTPLLVVDADDLQAGLDLWRSTEGIRSFDSVLAAAVMRRQHLTTLVSAARGFSRVPGLNVTAPADL
jgi:predicted nucleic acid-binding protein